jgi:GAF domain-containing protein/class 3 adenylate cyclase/anti-sigma regulatory factor (Ser/Thr protein kinase)
MNSYNPLEDGYAQIHIAALEKLIAETSRADLARLTTYLRRYISPLVTRDLFGNMQLGSLLLQYEIPVITALVFDIRDFVHTTQAGQRAIGLSAIANLLENIFSICVQTAFENRGLVGEFAGDRLLIVFGFPSFGDTRSSDLATSVMQAARTAVGIQQMSESIRRNQHLPDVLREFDIGIGLCTGGPAWIGDIGTLWRRELTIISNTVNIAARAEELTKKEKLMAPAPEKKIITDQVTIDAITQLVGAGNITKYELGRIEVRGLDEPVPLFHVAGMRLDALPQAPPIEPRHINLSTWICEYIEGAMERRVALEVHRALSSVGQVVTSAPGQETVLQEIMSQVKQIFDIKTATLYLVDPLTKELVFENIISESKNPPKRGERLPPGTGIVGRVVEQKKEELILDVREDDQWYGKIGSDIRSMLCVPLLAIDRVVGAIQVMDKTPGKFSSNELNLLQAFASSATMSLENARLYEQASSTAQAQRHIAEALTSSLDLEEVLETIMTALKDTLRARTATLYLVDPLTKELIFENIISESKNPPKRGERLPPGTGVVGRVVEQKKEELILDVREDDQWYGKIGSDIRSMLCVPLLAKDRVVGAIQVMDATPNRFTEGDLSTLTWLAAAAAVAVDNAAQFQALGRAKSELESAHRRLIASETMAGLGDIAGKLAHTLTNKASAIQYFAQHLLPEQGGEDVQETANLILENAQAVLAEIRRIREPLTDWSSQCVNVDEAVAEAVQEMEKYLKSPRLSKTEITLNHELVSEPLSVFCGKGQLRYIFRNLLDNAVHAIEDKGAPRGTIGIRSARETVREVDWAVVQVEDTGIGIDLPNLEQVFQLDYTTRPEGTVGGYGLFWVKLTVERLGGTISLVSRPGVGTKFTVRLPLVNNANSEMAG